jgi:hypothetical protein
MTVLVMSEWHIVDTWDDFCRFWVSAQSLPLSQQIELWKSAYMAAYPELLRKQVQDYEEQGVDWRQVAAERVFPHLPERLPFMQGARGNLLQVCGPVYERAVDVLGVGFDARFVLYVGIGCGAGWATQYEGLPACLLGLENIAEEGWHSRERLEGLVAHELGHLTHMAWRDEWAQFAENERQPMFLLYSEGFAGRCEEAILPENAGHLDRDGEWQPWCTANQAWLAAEFLRREEAGEPARDFFGSWYEIRGHSQTGYYLGREFIRWLERGRALREVATLIPNDVAALAREFLCLAAQGQQAGTAL